MSVITIKKTDDGRLYCPIRNCPCLGVICALYNDDARACALSAQSLHLITRTAVTDAAVEIARTYREEGAK